ncbi:MAG: hypothetical protein H0W28_08475 [Pyrinomonadaceae bacterium]|nr:hypothetical protein [Pyrinomonadaceae bacterium]
MSKAITILAGEDERLDHFGGNEVAAEQVELRQPKLVAVVVSVRRVRAADTSVY